MLFVPYGATGVLLVTISLGGAQFPREVHVLMMQFRLAFVSDVGSSSSVNAEKEWKATLLRMRFI
jgi:hypothetical protein